MFTNLPRVSPPQAASLMAGRIPQPWGEAPGPQPDECLHDSLRAGRAGCGGVSPCAPAPLHSGFFPARCGGVHPAAPLGWGLSRKWYKAVSEGSGSGSGMSPLHPASRTVRVLPQLLAGAVSHRACVQAPRPRWAGGTFLPHPLPQRPAPSPWVSGTDTSQASQTWNLLYVVIRGGEYGMGILSVHFLYLFCICQVCLLSEDGTGFPSGVPEPSPLAPTRRGHPELSQKSPGGPHRLALSQERLSLLKSGFPSPLRKAGFRSGVRRQLIVQGVAPKLTPGSEEEPTCLVGPGSRCAAW